MTQGHGHFGSILRCRPNENAHLMWAFTDAHIHSQAFTDAHIHPQTLTDTHRRPQTLTDAHRHSHYADTLNVNTATQSAYLGTKP